MRHLSSGAFQASPIDQRPFGMGFDGGGKGTAGVLDRPTLTREDEKRPLEASETAKAATQ